VLGVKGKVALDYCSPLTPPSPPQRGRGVAYPSSPSLTPPLTPKGRGRGGQGCCLIFRGRGGQGKE